MRCSPSSTSGQPCPPRLETGAGLGRVPVDRGSQSGRDLGAAAMLGSALARRRLGDVAAVRLLYRLHGARGARQQEPAVRAAHGADFPAAVRLLGGRRVPPSLVACRPGAGLLSRRRLAAVPPLSGRRPVDRTEHPAQSARRLCAALSGTPVSAPRRSSAKWPRIRSCSPQPRTGRTRCRKSPPPTGLRERNLHYYIQQLVGFALCRAALSLGRQAAQSETDAHWRRRSLAALLVPLRLPQCKPDPQRRPGPSLCRAHQTALGGMVRRRLRAPVPAGIAAPLCQRRAKRRIRDRRVLEPADADRRRGAARRWLGPTSASASGARCGRRGRCGPSWSARCRRIRTAAARPWAAATSCGESQRPSPAQRRTTGTR